MNSSSYDVVVVGGGPAGAVAGTVSAGFGLRTIVLEAATQPRWKPGESLAPECNPILERTGLSAMLASRSDIALRSSGVRSLWGSDEANFRDGFREPLGAGWVVDRCTFEGLLSSRAIEAGAQWLWGARVHSVERSNGVWRIHSAGTGEVRGRVMIDATGRPASIARRIGAKRIQYESQIANVITWRATWRPAGSWITVESVPDGWWYATSGPGGSQILAWFREGRGTHIREFCDNMPAAFAATRFVKRFIGLPPWRALIDQVIVSAGSTALEVSAGDGWLAVGDAAAAFDPISSQGLSNAIASGEAAAHAAYSWIQRGGDALNAYSARMTATYEIYRSGVLAHYRSETRWLHRAFWRHRHGTRVSNEA